MRSRVVNILITWRPLCLLGVMLLATHVLFASRYLANWDAGQFALGTVHYDLAMHQPHPPGYFLYVKFAALISGWTHDANSAFLFLNIVFGLAALVLLYWCVLQMTESRRAASWVGLLLLSNPVFWYYHLVANTYIIEAFAVTVALASTIAVYRTHRAAPFITSIVTLALAMGFRPTVVLGCLPLLLLQAMYVRPRLQSWILALVSGSAALLVWLVPNVAQVGGWAMFSQTVLTQLRGAAAGVHNLNQLEFLAWSLVLMVNASAVVLLWRAKTVRTFFRQREWWMIAITIAWNLALYLGLHFGEVGYLLSLLPLYLLLLAPVLRSYTTGAGPVVVALLVASNVALFLFAPRIIQHPKVVRASYPAIREHDERLAVYLAAVRAATPDRTLVVVLRGDYFTPQKTVSAYPYDDIRILEYYLPNYALYDILGVRGIYFRATNWQYEQVNGTLITFPRTVDRLVVLADYLHPDVMPSGVSLVSNFSGVHASNVYTGDLSTVDGFEFQGFTFSREDID